MSVSGFVETHPQIFDEAEWCCLQEEAACSIQRVWRGHMVRCAMPCSRSLEEEFGHICFTPVDVYKEINFLDYLEPNEGNVIDVKPHIVKMRGQGLIVSTGTERSLFDLALSTPCKCEGLVVRDINPRVKAYVDFVVLLLRISKNCEEFCNLSQGIHIRDARIEKATKRSVLNAYKPFFFETQKDSNFEERVAVIREKLRFSFMPENVKSYYEDHLDDFAKVYFSSDMKWKYPGDESSFFRDLSKHAFVKVMYYRDRHLFNSLQRYAQSGNIIATVGDIGEIHVLQGRKVSLVDVSNIPDYALIDLRGCEPFSPVVIWTRYPSCQSTQYYSYIHESINDQERLEFADAMHVLCESGIVVYNGEVGCQIYGLMGAVQGGRCERESLRPPSYSREVLTCLKMYKELYVRFIPRLGWVSFNGRKISRLDELSTEELEQFVRSPEFQQDSKLKELISIHSCYLSYRVSDFFSNCPGFF